MADYNSETPIRSQLPGQVLPDDVIIKIGDATNPTTQMASVDVHGSQQTTIADASGNIVSSQTVAASVWLQTIAPSNGPASGGTAAAYSNLAGAIYLSSAPTLTSGQQASLLLDVSGNLLVDLVTPIPAGTNNIGKIEITDGTNVVGVAPASTAAIATQPAAVVALSPNSPIPVGSNLIGKIEITDGTNVGGVTPASTAAIATQPAQVVALSPNSPVPAGTNNIGSVNAQTYVSGSPVSLTNPMPVTVTTASSGTPIQAALTATAIAVNANGTMTYTVPATHTFSLERILISAESQFKATVTINGVLAYTVFNSASNPNCDITVTAPPTLTAGETVVIVCTNIDKGSTNFYATVEGNQVS